MKYQYIILEICALLIYAKHVHSSSLKFTNGKINVDDFLKRVIDSEKFEEIAEKIAEKAADKFRSIRVGSVPKSDHNADSDDDEGAQATYRVSEVTKKHSKKIGSISKRDNNRDEYVVEKIDTAAVLKRESVDSYKNLSLKYKHFKEGSDGVMSKDQDDKLPNDAEVAQSNESTDQQSTNEDENEPIQGGLKKKDEEAEADIDTATIKPRAVTDRSTKLYSDKNDRTPDYVSEKSDEIEIQNDMSAKSIPTSHQKEPGSKRTGRHKNQKFKPIRDEMLGEKRHSDHKLRTPSYEYLKQADPSEGLVNNVTDIRNSKENTTLDRNSTKEIMDSIESIPISLNSSQKTEKTTLKLRMKDIIQNSKLKRQQNTSIGLSPSVRRERNHLYTYEKSTDYEEYHSQINQLNNIENENDTIKILKK